MQVTESKRTFTYRQSPVLSRSWLIYSKDQGGDLTPIGDYTVLDREESPDISEKKIINLVSVLNDSDDMILLGEQTKTRLLFQRKAKFDPRDPEQVIFYTYTPEGGVSRENAILTLKPGVA